MVSLLQGQLGQGKAQADYKSLIDELRKAAKIEYLPTWRRPSSNRLTPSLKTAP